MNLKSRTVYKGEQLTAVKLRLAPEAGDDHRIISLLTTSTRRIIRDLVNDRIVLLRDLCSEDGAEIVLRDGERAIDVVKLVIDELNRTVEELATASRRTVNTLCRHGEHVVHTHAL